MALYFYFNETTGDLVYSDQATYDAEGYASLGEQTNMKPTSDGDWVFGSKKSGIKTVTKDPAAAGKIAGLTSMAGMFSDCFSLVSIDLSGFDTSQATDMSYMFDGCLELANLDLSGFDTSQVTSMTSMFSDCFSLVSIDLSGFDTSKVTVMRYMFNGCSALKTLDLSGFDTSRAAIAADMFQGCSLDTVRCRPKQFLEHVVPTADEASAAFLIPSSSGAWYDFKGAEVTDFTSDAATSLYSDPSKAPDGSKLVNLQDLKAALEAMGGSPSSSLPLTEDTVIAEVGGEPVWSYTEDAGDGFPGFVGRIAQGEQWLETALSCMHLRLEGKRIDSEFGLIGMAIGMGLTANGPTIVFGYGSKRAAFTYKDGMPVLSAMGETGPVMAGDHPYGFATYATDSDFMDYITQTE